MAWNPNKKNRDGSSWTDPQGNGSYWLVPEPVKTKWLTPVPIKSALLQPTPVSSAPLGSATISEDVATSNTSSCTDSNQCASGWLCSGGVCVEGGSPASGSTFPTQTSPSFQSSYPGYEPINGQSSGGTYYPNSSGASNTPVGARYPRGTGSGGGGGGTSGCGDDYYNDPDGNKVPTPCEPNPADNGCRKSGCGLDRFNASDCCGESRCCRYSANGVGVTVSCSCGDCPDPSDECNSFCSNFRAANGQLYPGCNDQSICDECSDCVSTPGGPPGTSCQPKVIGQAPCQCEASSCSLACDRCDPDGVCRVDCDNCVVPFPTYARCSCGDFRTTSYVNACGARWADPVDCSALCEERDEPDKCAGTCTSVSWCEGQPTPPCPAGSSCSSNGSISAGGKTCYIRTDCDKTNVPPECEECDCNCEDDCPDCELCGDDGECYPDPACESNKIYLILSFSNPKFKIGNDLCNAPGLFNTYEGCSCYESLDNPGCTGGGGITGGKYTQIDAEVKEYKLNFTLERGDTFYFDSVKTGGTMNTTYCRYTLYGDYVTWFALANTRHVLLINGYEYNPGWNVLGNPGVCKQATEGETERVPMTFSWRSVTREEYAESTAIWSQPGPV